MQIHCVPLRPLAARILAIGLATVVAIGCGSSASPAATSPGQSTAPLQTTSASPTAAPAVTSSPSPAPATPAGSPAGSPALGGERLKVLLGGLDHTTEREFSELTDTLIVASLDPVAGTVSLLGLPRDLTDFPLPSGAIYREKLNSLYAEIQANPERFGGAAGDEPFAVLASVVVW